jgi:Protein of unknown function (DUF732)
MRTTRFLASAAVAVGAATIFAATASAQTAVDQAFLNAVRDKGVPISSDAQALDLAHSTCGVLSNGGSASDALSKIASATNWSTDQASTFGSMAVVAYCKDLMQGALQSAQAPDADVTQGSGPQMNVPRYTPKNSPDPRAYKPYGEMPCRDASGCK